MKVRVVATPICTNGKPSSATSARALKPSRCAVIFCGGLNSVPWIFPKPQAGDSLAGAADHDERYVLWRQAQAFVERIGWRSDWRRGSPTSPPCRL